MIAYTNMINVKNVDYMAMMNNINSDGELVSRCFECFENPDNYDDGYYIGND